MKKEKQEIEQAFLNIQEVAIMFGVTTATIRNWLNAGGMIPAPHIIGKVKKIWKKETIVNFLKEKEENEI